MSAGGVTIAVYTDDDRERIHSRVTAWTVEGDGTLWLLHGDDHIATYAQSHWRWVEQRQPDGTPPCCTPDRPHPAAPQVDR